MKSCIPLFSKSGSKWNVGCSIYGNQQSTVFRRRSLTKGAAQFDFVVGFSIFFVIFAFIVHYTTFYYSSVKETMELTTQRSDAFSLLRLADFGFDPPSFELQTEASTVLLMHLNNNTLDSTGINNGTSYADCSRIEGRFGYGCLFNGYNGYINAGSSATLNIYGNLTMEAWIKPRNLDAAERTIIARWTASKGYTLELLDAKIWMSADNGGVAGTTALKNNTWYHIAGVFNGTACLVYLNGLNEANASCTLSSVSTPFIIGNFAGSFFNGTIDEIAVYNRSLSVDEIKGHYQKQFNRIGLSGNAYRFYIAVNNSQSFYYNQSANFSNLSSEIVTFNLTDADDINSVFIYDESGNPVSYQVNGTNISFASNVALNTVSWYTVYYGEGSFLNHSTAVSGTDNLSETLYPKERVKILEFEKLRQLNLSNYTYLKSALPGRDFHINIYDLQSNSTYIDFGGDPPLKGDVVALQRYVVYQNSTAGIRNGRMIVQAW